MFESHLFQIQCFSSMIIQNMYFFSDYLATSWIFRIFGKTQNVDTFLIKNVSMDNCNMTAISFFLDLNSSFMITNFSLLNLKFVNNSFQNTIFSIISNYYETDYYLSEIMFFNNDVFGQIFEFNSNSFEIKQRIFIESLYILNSNLKSMKFLEYDQHFIVFRGSFNIKIHSNHFVNNLCSIGPCGYAFFSDNPNFMILVNATIFTNNIAFYSSENQNIICLIYISGTLNMTLTQIIMKNNSINKYDVLNGFSLGEEGNPCILTTSDYANLLIVNSLFSGNLGYKNDSSSCISFSGNIFAIINSSFINQKTIDGFEVFTLNIDCSELRLVNVIFMEGNCGGIFLFTVREEFFFEVTNLTITETKFFTTSFFILYTQKYFITFSNVIFTSNLCFSDHCFMNIFNMQGDVMNHIFNLSNSYFLHNQLLVGGIVSIVTIGSLSNISSCIFDNNTSSIGRGVAFYVGGEYTNYVYFFNCSFFKNLARIGGVGVLELGTLFIIDCLLENNSVLDILG